MTSEEFLKQKGLIKKDHHKFMINGYFGTVNLGELLEEYSKQTKEVTDGEVVYTRAELLIICRKAMEYVYDDCTDEDLNYFIMTI